MPPRGSFYGMHYFPDPEAYERHKAERLRGDRGGGDGMRERHFFGRPGGFPCVGIEETVEVAEGLFHVYLVDFARVDGARGEGGSAAGAA